MKHIKTYKVFENSVRLAADIYLNSKEGDWMIGVNDPFDVKFCNVSFPDGIKITFKVIREDYTSEFLNLKIGIPDHTSYPHRGIFEFYLTVFGDNIQFESLNEYKFVRKYLTKEDLLEHEFDSYIYSDNHNGPFDIQVKICNSESSGFLYATRGIIGEYNNILRSEIANLVKSDKNWKSNISNIVDGDQLVKLYRKIEDDYDYKDIETLKSTDALVNYGKSKFSLCAILYLYHILRGIKDVKTLKELLANPNSANYKIYLKILGELT